MTKIKFCGLSSFLDIENVNILGVDYVGFVFFKKSKRYISLDKARELKKKLSPKIKAVGVFVDEDIEKVIDILKSEIIDIAQLHGKEDDDYIKELKNISKKEVIKAYQIRNLEDVYKAENSLADYILLDSGKGSGKVFDWEILKEIKRPYFLAGGLSCDNVGYAIEKLSPFGVDVSSGIESDGRKDNKKMKKFVEIVRKEEKNDKS